MTRERDIRVLTASEVETLVDWAAGEGWNPGSTMLRRSMRRTRKGFSAHSWAARWSPESPQSPMAMLSVSSASTSAIRSFAARATARRCGTPAWRGLAGRPIGLDGVDQQVANYARMGFSPAYRTIRHSGRLSGASVHPTIQPIGSDLAAEVEALDRRFFPAPRRSFLDHWLKPPHVALAAMRDGAVVGYAVARQCRQGWKVGPVFAMDEADARNLLSGLAASIGDVEIHVDVPEPAREFSAFLVQAGFVPGFVTTRMYTRPRRRHEPVASRRRRPAWSSADAGRQRDYSLDGLKQVRGGQHVALAACAAGNRLGVLAPKLRLEILVDMSGSSRRPRRRVRRSRPPAPAAPSRSAWSSRAAPTAAAARRAGRGERRARRCSRAAARHG